MSARAITALSAWFLFSAVVAIRADEPARTPADEARVAPLVSAAIQAAGGEEKLLRLFRIREELVLNPDGQKPPSVRVSVLEPPKYWWMNKKERVSEQQEPATNLVWVWTLTALKDPTCKLSPLPDLTDGDVSLKGLQIGGAISPPMDVYFHPETSRLSRIDWRSDIHRFSEWKVVDGVGFPSRTVGTKKKDGKVWYESNVVELTRLSELPPDITRPAAAEPTKGSP